MTHSQNKGRMHRKHGVVQTTKKEHCKELVWIQLCFAEKTETWRT